MPHNELADRLIKIAEFVRKYGGTLELNIGKEAADNWAFDIESAAEILRQI